MRVAVLHGGTSPESLASTQNARQIAIALRENGHDATLVEYGPGAPQALREQRPGKVFIAVQGVGHGDGAAQSLCGLLGLPHTGAVAGAAAVVNDKFQSKLVCGRYGLQTPPFLLLRAGDLCGAETLKEIERTTGYPAVVKENGGGGSFGIWQMRGPEDAPKLRAALTAGADLLVERFVPGRFVTAGLLQTPGGLRVLPLFTAKAERKQGLLLFTGDFTPGPAALEEETEAQVVSAARRLFRALGMRGYGRIDFMLGQKGQLPWFLEANAVPGLRAGSLFPAAAKAAGYSPRQVCEYILQA